MPKVTIKMTRTQRTKFGMLHAGVAYNIDVKTSDDEKVIKNLLDKKFATKTTEKQVLDASAKLNAKKSKGKDGAKSGGDDAAQADAKNDEKG